MRNFFAGAGGFERYRDITTVSAANQGTVKSSGMNGHHAKRFGIGVFAQRALMALLALGVAKSAFRWTALDNGRVALVRCGSRVESTRRSGRFFQSDLKVQCLIGPQLYRHNDAVPSVEPILVSGFRNLH